jgi:hypothetical protein
MAGDHERGEEDERKEETEKYEKTLVFSGL